MSDPAKKPDPRPQTPPGPRVYTRRELIQVGGTLAAGAAIVGAGVTILDRNPGGKAKKLAKIKDHRVELAAGATQLAIARGLDPAENVKRVVEALGGMGLFVKPGDKVLIKPNVGWNRLPEQAANTTPELVAAVVRMVAAAGASQIWVSDNPVNTAERCFDRSGIKKAIGEAGGTLVLPEGYNFREVEVGGHILKSAEVISPLVDADKVINLPIVKQHGLSGATLSMKNWYGILGGHRVRLHQDIHRSVVDLAMMARPTLTILDATRMLLANGPSGGSLDDVKRMDTVAAGVDEVALDAFGASLLGLSPEQVGFIPEAEKRGYGRSDWKSLKIQEIAG